LSLIFIEFANLEYWTPDDRFCVVSTPEGWLGIDYLPATAPRSNFSQAFDTREEAQNWCREQLEADCVPDATVGVAEGNE
jgi:hypothetical protein